MKPVFFGRKFEPAVNQDIINSMDVYLFGNEMTGNLKIEPRKNAGRNEFSLLMSIMKFLL